LRERTYYADVMRGLRAGASGSECQWRYALVYLYICVKLRLVYQSFSQWESFNLKQGLSLDLGEGIIAVIFVTISGRGGGWTGGGD